MNRLIAIALLSSCGVADTSLLLTVPAPGAKDGGIDPGDIQISIPASFGRAPVGGVYRQPLRLSNSGSKVASVELVRVDGRSDVFGIDLGERRAIFPGNEMEVALVYVPIGGAEAATFVFNTCADAGSCIVERSVTGVGLDMAFRCEGGDVGRVRAGECLFADVACINDSDYSVFVDGVRWSGSPAFLPSFPPTAEIDS